MDIKDILKAAEKARNSSPVSKKENIQKAYDSLDEKAKAGGAKGFFAKVGKKALQATEKIAYTTKKMNGLVCNKCNEIIEYDPETVKYEVLDVNYKTERTESKGITGKNSTSHWKTYAFIKTKITCKCQNCGEVKTINHTFKELTSQTDYNHNDYFNTMTATDKNKKIDIESVIQRFFK